MKRDETKICLEQPIQFLQLSIERLSRLDSVDQLALEHNVTLNHCDKNWLFKASCFIFNAMLLRLLFLEQVLNSKNPSEEGLRGIFDPAVQVANKKVS